MRTIRKLWGRLGAEALLFCVILGIWSYAGANGAAGGKSAETSGAPVMNEMSDADGPDSESSAAAGQGAAGGAAGSGKDGSGEENSEEENSGEENSGKKDYIHWVDFDICLEAMSQALPGTAIGYTEETERLYQEDRSALSARWEEIRAAKA